MEPIRSGTTTERLIRTLILMVILVGYSALSFKDGYVSYPQKNVDVLKQNLASPESANPTINSKITAEAMNTIKDANTLSAIIEQFGQPSVQESTAAFYFGPAGLAKINIIGDRVTGVQWLPGNKTQLDLLFQKLIGLITGILGLLMIAQFFRALSTKTELTDAGLKVSSQGGFRWGGSPPIPFEAMTALETSQYKKKGWVEVQYKLSDGTEGSVSLNDYVHKAFPEIVAELCNRKGFENPIRAHKQNPPPPDDSAEGQADLESTEAKTSSDT